MMVTCVIHQVVSCDMQAEALGMAGGRQGSVHTQQPDWRSCVPSRGSPGAGPELRCVPAAEIAALPWREQALHMGAVFSGFKNQCNIAKQIPTIWEREIKLKDCHFW